MADLVERYIHEVGRYLPDKERGDIEAELRSQIHDRLEDRYGGAASQADVAAVLTELGDPRRMAASFAGEQYLVGPALYPAMMLVLRRGWVLIPTVVVVVRVLTAFFDGAPRGLLVESLLGAAQATFIFSAITVLVFALIERSGEDLDELTGRGKGFDPRTLPAIDDPAAVDRFDAIFGAAFGAFMALALLYFLRVGGLTWRVDLADPGAVLPVPIPWLSALLVATVGGVVLQLVALLRNRWPLGLWLLNLALGLAAAVAAYYALLQPALDFILERVPWSAEIPGIERLPAVSVAVVIVVNLLATDGVKAVRMWRYRRGAGHNET